MTADLYARVVQHLDDTDDYSPLRGVVERHKPERRHAIGQDGGRPGYLYCRTCHATADRCNELPAIARDLGIDP